MEDIGAMIRQLRKSKNLRMIDVVASTGIDQALLSKYEQGKRIPTDEHVKLLAICFEMPFAELKKRQLAEKVYQLLAYEDFALEALHAAESRIEYLSKSDIESKFELSSTTREMLKTLDELNDRLKVYKSTLSDSHLHKLEDQFGLTYTYESNKIEGNTLTLSETMLVIKEGITISGKSVNEHLEAINHAEAISLMYELAKGKIHLDQRTLLQLHGLILRGIDRSNAGVYRRLNVRILGAEHIPPEPYIVPKLMEDYFLFYNSHVHRLHPVILAAEMHERLVTIHPFIDGNGRTSRLIMNLILVMNGYPIAILKGDPNSRMQYFDALANVQVKGNTEPFYHLVIDRLTQTIEEQIDLVKPIEL